MKNNKLTLIGIVLVTAFFLSSLYLIYTHHMDDEDNFSCSAQTTYLFETHDQELEALFLSQMQFIFKNGEGINLITGRLQQGERHYTVDRRVLFTYEHNKNNTYTLTTTDVIFNDNDNLPKSLSERYLYRFSTDKGQTTYLTIVNLNSGNKLFTSGSLPYFMCK